MKIDKQGRTAKERYTFEYREARRIDRGRSKKHPIKPYKGTRHVALGKAERAMPLGMLPDKQRHHMGNTPVNTQDFMRMIRETDPIDRSRVLGWWRRDLASFIDWNKRRPIPLP